MTEVLGFHHAEMPTGETRRPLDFNETQPAAEFVPSHGGAADDIFKLDECRKDGGMSPTAQCTDSHSVDLGTPQTTRKPPIMSKDRYDQLRDMLMARREQRLHTHDSIIRDTEACNAMSRELEMDALPRALSSWADSYDLLQAAIERSPATKSFLSQRAGDSPVGRSAQTSSLQNGSPSAAAKTLRPVLEAIEALETRRAELASIQSLERKLHLAQDKAALRVQSFLDEKSVMEHELQAAQADTRQQRRREQQLQSDLTEKLSESELTNELQRICAELTLRREAISAQRDSLHVAEQKLRDRNHELVDLRAACVDVAQQLSEITAKTFIGHDEPKGRTAVASEELAARALLTFEATKTALGVSRRSAENAFERVHTQLAELQRLCNSDLATLPTTETLAALKKDREHVVAEVRELNAAMHDLDEEIHDLATGLLIDVDGATTTMEEVRMAQANCRALEVVLERRRDLLESAAASEEERRVIDRWLQEDTREAPPMFGEIEGAHDGLAQYRTLHRQCVILGGELSSVHVQQREQQEFTSLGLYHNLEDDISDAKAKVEALEVEESNLSTTLSDALAKEKETNEARERLINEESTATAEVDALRDEELQALSQTSRLKLRLRALLDDEKKLEDDEAAHHAERHRRYMVSLGVIQQDPLTPSPPPDVRPHPKPIAQRRLVRSREEVLADSTTTLVTVTTLPQSPLSQPAGTNSTATRWWWPWGRPHQSRSSGSI